MKELEKCMEIVNKYSNAKTKSSKFNIKGSIPKENITITDDISCKDLEDIIDKLRLLKFNGQLRGNHLRQLRRLCMRWAAGSNVKIKKLSNIKKKVVNLSCENCYQTFKFKTEYSEHTKLCQLNNFEIKSIEKLNYKANFKPDLDMNLKLEKLLEDRKMYSSLASKCDIALEITAKDANILNKPTIINSEVDNDPAKLLAINSSFTCIICSLNFTTYHNLQRHSKLHKTEKSYLTSKQEFLEDGHKKHTDRHKYRCTYCNMSTYLKRSLAVHMRIHTREQRYVCSECGMSFAYTNSLNIHSRTHTGEKPFKCFECDKRFASKSNLKAHHSIHAAEKTFKCEACEKMFMTCTALKKHARQHNVERPFRCNICEKTFCTNSTLKTHIKIHTGERAHVCAICSKAFIRNAHLIRHLQTIHKSDSSNQKSDQLLNGSSRKLEPSRVMSDRGVNRVPVVGVHGRIEGKELSSLTTQNSVAPIITALLPASSFDVLLLDDGDETGKSDQLEESKYHFECSIRNKFSSVDFSSESIMVLSRPTVVPLLSEISVKQTGGLTMSQLFNLTNGNSKFIDSSYQINDNTMYGCKGVTRDIEGEKFKVEDGVPGIYEGPVRTATKDLQASQIKISPVYKHAE